MSVQKAETMTGLQTIANPLLRKCGSEEIKAVYCVYDG